MCNSGFYQIVFRGRWKLPQMRAIANFAVNIFYWVAEKLTRSYLDYLNLFQNDVFTGLKHRNWHLVEGDKNLVGDSTKGRSFPGSGRENKQIFG